MNRTREQLIEAVQMQMPAARWQHTQGVMTTAVQLAKKYGADPDKADLAAILHDVAKYWQTDRMERMIREHHMPSELLEHDKQLWHAPVGAYVAEHEYGIEDEEILDAIRYHTSGREKMTLLDKVVCLADYIEPGRDFPGVEHIRELAEQNLNAALIAGFDSTISLLIERRRRIFPLTISARNGLLAELQAELEQQAN
ncbi:bis(5'-nucleosyl)-tetraphosphatase (symmetrical) YqeK [Paenibacillus alvei]|uniref:bis(5'-nucleosyl)-tetraphosphatase (symmetrical) n=1 Tax=Paenibacillus alvei TaxID=44250 RepID=A0AAP6ZXB4_PAEAL|nr:bis(5'-nucleosyl)-tetraphosphatase (symmetrical) YqeK [Paenibacillus alvei]MBG9734171.1 phosphohydrolase [Paenibacillus alvei]MBG9744536.1 phosphohydrolase [Paenibacillus alvei]MCY9582203.1 bis(5'-nucleosyl)-tetraphosphatase (symmetrical) YqeK [Paenibacillus alvei]MCY9587005.1 bis(5'-nucleosyl)-tetraphosphatase (symmetrical) YqeK [Paenibacillus alvei]NEZ40977.1 HD domain-containing protein [Paenibacillus alvei]